MFLVEATSQGVFGQAETEKPSTNVILNRSNCVNDTARQKWRQYPASMFRRQQSSQLAFSLALLFCHHSAPSKDIYGTKSCSFFSYSSDVSQTFALCSVYNYDPTSIRRVFNCSTVVHF